MIPFSLIVRACLIMALLLFELSMLYCLPHSVTCKTNLEHHTLAEHYQSSHEAMIDFQFSSALTETLFRLIPFWLVFLILDLYCLRKAPVEHLGFFAYWMISVALSVLLSWGLWFFFDGWGPPNSGWLLLAIFGVMAIPAFISERRIFRERPPASDDGE